MLITLVTLAAAADLDVTVVINDAPPLSLTFHDVAPGPIPALDVGTMNGHTVRLGGTLARPAPDQVSFDMRIVEVTTDRRGREHPAIVSSPRVTAIVGEDATVSMGTRSKDGVEAAFEVRLLYKDGGAS
jgi:hypothetical protein